jgi:ribosomal protein S18 acetylase RimI-like enzyme
MTQWRVLWATARLHARRFNRNPIVSVLRLLSADKRFIDPDGGVAVITEVGHAWRWGALFALTYTPLLAGLAFSIYTLRVSLLILTFLASALSCVVFATRFERQLRARHFHRGHASKTWILSDLATEPGRRIGDRLISQVTEVADAESATMQLEVRPTNGTAVRLYERHGFEFTRNHRQNIQMRRLPAKAAVKAEFPRSHLATRCGPPADDFGGLEEGPGKQ